MIINDNDKKSCHNKISNIKFKIAIAKVKKARQNGSKNVFCFLQIGSNKHERRRLVSGRLGGYGNSHKSTFYCK